MGFVIVIEDFILMSRFVSKNVEMLILLMHTIANLILLFLPFPVRADQANGSAMPYCNEGWYLVL